MAFCDYPRRSAIQVSCLFACAIDTKVGARQVYVDGMVGGPAAIGGSSWLKERRNAGWAFVDIGIALFRMFRTCGSGGSTDDGRKIGRGRAPWIRAEQISSWDGSHRELVKQVGRL